MKITTALVRSTKRGNIKAIFTQMNRHLESEGITAKASIKNGCLQIMLESAQVPRQKALMAVLRKLAIGLGNRQIEKVKDLGMPVSAETSTWNEEVGLPVEPPVEPTATADRLSPPRDLATDRAKTPVPEVPPEQSLKERAAQGDAEAIVALLIAEIFK